MSLIYIEDTRRCHLQNIYIAKTFAYLHEITGTKAI